MKIFKFVLIFILTLSSSISCAYDGSTMASVVLAGGIIKAQHTDSDHKHKRKDCPVCKGKGWYMSGDGISKVECGYCEPDSGVSEVTHDPIILNDNNFKKPPVCNGPNCQINSKQPITILKR